MTTFNDRVNKSVDFVQEYFNHKHPDEFVPRQELRENLLSILNILKADYDSNN